MKSKMFLSIGAIAIGSALFAGYTQTQASKEIEEVNENADIPIYKSENYQVEKTEYSTFDEFAGSLLEGWAADSEIRQGAADQNVSDSSVLSPIYHYINYFEDDIREKKLTKEFDELQKTAFELNQLFSNPFKESEYEEMREEFEISLNKAVTAYTNTHKE